MWKSYADLLVNYSLYLKKGEHLYIRSTTLAEPLISEVYKAAIKVGAHVSVQMDFFEQHENFMLNASDEQLTEVPLFHKQAIETCDAYLYIKAPFLESSISISSDKRRIRQEALKEINQVYFERTASGSMKRSLCQFPTEVDAKRAGLTLEQFSNFVFKACGLKENNPVSYWKEVSKKQQKYVDFLNSKKTIRYKNKNSDISFSVLGRTWINSDGKTNMPSGEVFSSPVEDTVQGKIYFDYPTVYMGKEMEGITLEVKNGEVVSWNAKKGQEHMDQLLKTPGARFFGEVAIGTNYNIQRATKNILFDEKIGGTIHMALGQSYGQTGGKNQSSIHWDMICDMKNDAEILADEQVFYRNGQWLI